MSKFIGTYKKGKLNHSRVEYYRITHDGVHNNFLIHPDYLFEKALKFVYEDNGETIEKIIPVSKIGRYLKTKTFWGRDEMTLKSEYRGYAYMIDDKIIFRY